PDLTPSSAVISARVRSRPERSAAISLAVRPMEVSRPSSESAMIREGSSDPQRISSGRLALLRLAGAERDVRIPPPDSPARRVRTERDAAVDNLKFWARPAIIEHISVRCSDARASRDFYERSLAPLGYKVDKEYGDAFGFIQGGRHDFWVTEGKVGTPNHLAFHADDQTAVDEFYRAAIAA